MRRRPTMFLAVLGLALAACGGSGSSATGNGGTTQAAGSTTSSAGSAAATSGSSGNSAPTGSSSGSTGSGTATSGTTSSAGIHDAGPTSAGDGGATRSAGCGNPTTLTSGTANIDVSGMTRQYILALPANYDPNKPYKLIFGFHWQGGSASEVAAGTIIGGPYYGQESRSAGSAILVAPDGLSVDGGPKGWPNTNGQDIAFVQAMLSYFESNLCIDTSRIFSTGFSYGGIFSLLLGCQMSDVFRAIAPMSGEFFGSCRATNGRPVAVWQAQGDSDTTVPPANAQAANNYFVTKNGCSTQTMAVSPSPCVEYRGCQSGYPVTWCEFSGGHMPWSMAPDPIWAFFSQF